MITLNVKDVKDLNTSTKRQKFLVNKIYMLSIKKIKFKYKDTYRLKGKGWRKSMLTVSKRK